jgi:exodeoxyribonuclease III
MTLRLVTWNVNSVRLRIAALERLVAAFSPDVFCLQETKVMDDSFPLTPLTALGYRHTLVHGMKSYNGVAILSRLLLRSMTSKSWCERQDCRHAIALLPGNIELHNVYVPAGGDIPDPQANSKFAHKLQAAGQWVDAVRHFTPPDRKLFSWWSYRAQDWAASDRGRRLDHVWVTPALAGSLTKASVLREVRGWDRPSDHVPIIVDFA